MEFSSSIKDVILKYVNDQNVTFVFNTEIASDTWSEWIVRNDSITKKSAVPMERFLAWDEFKEKYINPKQDGKMAVSSLIRKLFARYMIKKNAINQCHAEGRFFSSIIKMKEPNESYDEYLEESLSFTAWISKILSSLHLWHELNQKKSEKNDKEDEDLELLYNEYVDFLNKNNLYEQSWLDVNLSEEKKVFIIFYPEILEDYNDYQDLFSKNENIIEIKMPKKSDEQEYFVYKYPDSRTELHYTALQIRNLIETKKAKWSEISLSIPDMNTYKPYVQRELDLYNIPYKFRVGDSFVKNCAGRIFLEFKDCVSSDFSFNSLRTLLCDNCIPWKTVEENKNLILQGNKLRCVCSYEQDENVNKKVDVWQSSLKSKSIEENDSFDILYKHYKKIVSAVKRICEAKTFSEIRDGWFIFKAEFLDESFEENSENEKDRFYFQNNILSSCIKELNSIIDVLENEKSVKRIKFIECEKPYDFFLDELKNKTYTPQSKDVGVSVFSYKTSAMATFKYQFVIDASQNAINIPYNYISFLTTDKRKLLFKSSSKQMDRSATDVFIQLYAKPENNYIFSCSESSFSGFTIANTYLTEKELENIEELKQIDFLFEEKKLFLQKQADSLKKNNITEIQIKRFLAWKETAQEFQSNTKSNDYLKKIIDKKLITDRNRLIERMNIQFNPQLIKITQSDMRNFFPCKRKWILNNILAIKEDSLDTDLMNNRDMGTIYHSVLENFMKHYYEKRLPLPVVNSDNVFENEEEVRLLVNEIMQKVLLNMDFCKSKIVYDVLFSQIDKISEPVIKFLHNFCIQDSEPIKKKDDTVNISSSGTKGFGGYDVVEVEKNFYKEEDNYSLYGKPDLVIANNEYTAIIDYKTNNPPSKEKFTPNKDSGTLDDYQLPMYISLLKDKYKHFDNVGFYSILQESKKVFAIDKYSYGKNEDGVPVQNKTEEDFEETMNVFYKYLDLFYEEVNKFDFEPKSGKITNYNNVDVYKNCLSCTYNNICRFMYTIASREMKKIKE